MVPIWKYHINNSVCKDLNDNSLKIICVQGLFGYRSGILGKISDYFSYNISQYVNPLYLSKFLNVDSNDLEIITFFISIITRIIPFYNCITIDPKNLFTDILGFINENHSVTSMFDYKSLFMLEPLYDSGCAIYSNKKYKYCGFEKWYCKNTISNKGMTWCYFESDDGCNGISVINIDFNDNNTDFEDIECLKHIVELKNNLEIKYATITNTYETYIVGNFNIHFNISNILYEIKDKLKIIENEGFEILNNIYGVDTTEFIFYNKYDSYNTVEHIDLSTIPLEIPCAIFYKFNRIVTIDKYTINPLFINQLKKRLKEIKNSRQTIKEEVEVNTIPNNLQQIKIDNISDKSCEINIKDDYFNSSCLTVETSLSDDWDIL